VPAIAPSPASTTIQQTRNQIARAMLRNVTASRTSDTGANTT
jgi:hypothetical protein